MQGKGPKGICDLTLWYFTPAAKVSKPLKQNGVALNTGPLAFPPMKLFPCYAAISEDGTYRNH